MKTEVEVHYKSWGREEWIVNTNLYCGKLLHVEKDKYCSLHCHIKKTETFHIIKGSVLFSYQESEITPNGDVPEIARVGEMKSEVLKVGDTFHIKRGLLHRFCGVDDENVILEVSTEHFESDSYRLEPSYPG